MKVQEFFYCCGKTKAASPCLPKDIMIPNELTDKLHQS